LTLDPLFSSTTQFSKIKSVASKATKHKIILKATLSTTRFFMTRKKLASSTGSIPRCQRKKLLFLQQVSVTRWAVSKTWHIYTDFWGLSTKKIKFWPVPSDNLKPRLFGVWQPLQRPQEAVGDEMPSFFTGSQQRPSRPGGLAKRVERAITTTALQNGAPPPDYGAVNGAERSSPLFDEW
jgi:hypothetical protein